MDSKKFYIRLLIFTWVIASVIYGVQYFKPELLQGYLIWAALAFFVGVTALTFYLGKLGLKGSNKTFLKVVYGSMMIRMFFSLMFLVIYLIFSEEVEVPFVVSFLILYLLFTMFEIYSLVANLRPDLKQ